MIHYRVAVENFEWSRDICVNQKAPISNQRLKRATSAEDLMGLDRKGELGHLKVVPLPLERQLSTYPSGEKATKKDTRHTPEMPI